MGEAKKRGSRAERAATAIAAGRVKTPTGPFEPPHPRQEYLIAGLRVRVLDVRTRSDHVGIITFEIVAAGREHTVTFGRWRKLGPVLVERDDSKGSKKTEEIGS